MRREDDPEPLPPPQTLAEAEERALQRLRALQVLNDGKLPLPESPPPDDPDDLYELPTLWG